MTLGNLEQVFIPLEEYSQQFQIAMNKAGVDEVRVIHALSHYDNDMVNVIIDLCDE